MWRGKNRAKNICNRFRLLYKWPAFVVLIGQDACNPYYLFDATTTIANIDVSISSQLAVIWFRWQFSWKENDLSRKKCDRKICCISTNINRILWLMTFLFWSIAKWNDFFAVIEMKSFSSAVCTEHYILLLLIEKKSLFDH